MRKVLKNGILLLLVLVLTAGSSQAAYADTTTAMQAAAAAISSSEIELNWNSVDGARSYVIYRSNAREGGYQKLKTVSAATLSYRDSKISTAVNYYYKIVPVSGATGEEMTAVQVILKAKAPAKTSVEKVSVKSPTKITLTWKASAGRKRRSRRCRMRIISLFCSRRKSIWCVWRPGIRFFLESVQNIVPERDFTN